MKAIELKRRYVDLHNVISEWLDRQDDEYWKGEIDDQMTEAAFAVYIAAMEIQAYKEGQDALFDEETKGDDE